MISVRQFLGAAVLGAAAIMPAPAQAPAARDDFAAVRDAWRQGRTNDAIALLVSVPESDPGFLRAMTQLGPMAEAAGRPELSLAGLERARRQAPDDMELAHAFIRAQVLARTNLSVQVTVRPVPKVIPDEFRFIAGEPKFPDDSRKFPRVQLMEDLEFLEVLLANVYSYADRRGTDWRSALDVVRASLADETPLNTFHFRLRRFLTVFGDPHTAIRSAGRGFLPSGGTPFLPVADGPRVLALRPDRKAFLDGECRWLEAMDGVPVSEWLRVASYDVPKSSRQMERRNAVSALAQLEYLRTELEVKPATNVTVTLISADGMKKKELTLAVARTPPRIRLAPRGRTRELDGHIGYLRLASMNTDRTFLRQLDESMSRFRDTRGLVIDVRGNGGGAQDAVRTLLPYFLPTNAPMRIINVAAYRLPVVLAQPCREGYLGLHGRGLHPATSRVWNDEERRQIERLIQGFVPSWKLPTGGFSDWHVMGIRPATNPKAYYYGKRVIVLSDAGCFSATDNFLGALQGLPQVTLLGTTSGGGSGRMTSYTLPRTRTTLTLCQMASFRANGDQFDGRGVTPDVVVEPRAEDFLVDGTDSVLDAALARLRR